MSVLHVGDFQTGSWNGQALKIAIKAGGTTLPEQTLDDAVEIVTGDMGAINGKHRGMRLTVGDATVVCEYDTDLLSLTMGGVGASGIVDDLILTYTTEEGATVALNIPDMVVSAITPSSVESGSDATITLGFQRHDIAGANRAIKSSE